MKNIIFRIIRIVGTIFSFFNALFFFAMKPCWSGISSTIGYKGGDNVILFNLPIIICVLFFVIMIADIVLKKFFDKIGKEVVETYGKEKLKEIAKYNFKNTERILGIMIY